MVSRFKFPIGLERSGSYGIQCIVHSSPEGEPSTASLFGPAGHVNEVDSFIERIPEPYRETARPWIKELPDGKGWVFNLHGVEIWGPEPRTVRKLGRTEM
jgi:hypothetical protein